MPVGFVLEFDGVVEERACEVLVNEWQGSGHRRLIRLDEDPKRKTIIIRNRNSDQSPARILASCLFHVQFPLQQSARLAGRGEPGTSLTL